jgi:hypothetical protein
MDMVAGGDAHRVDEEEAGGCAHHVEEEEAGDDARNTDIYLNISGDEIEQSEDGADQ